MRNSTIKTKFGECHLCANGKEVALTKGMCTSHYWQSIRLKSFQKQQEKDLSQDKSLQNLIDDLDVIFSRYIRLSCADLYGNIRCYCCSKKINWKLSDAGHFIPRAHMYTRFSEDNVKPCCQKCNRFKDGELLLFAKHLEKEKPGIVEILQEQARITYKYTYDELKSMISNYNHKLNQLK